MHIPYSTSLHCTTICQIGPIPNAFGTNVGAISDLYTNSGYVVSSPMKLLFIK